MESSPEAALLFDPDDPPLLEMSDLPDGIYYTLDEFVLE